MSAPAQLHATAEALLRTLTVDAQTLVKHARSTIVPPRPVGGDGAMVALRQLKRDPGALVDEALIGQGGMGVVRLATQLALNRKVAVKTLRPEHQEPRSAEALVAEAWVAGALEHPNVVPVHDLTLDEHGMPALVMKRIEGVSWATLVADPAAMATHAPGREPLEAHLRILMQVCNVVHFAHSRGVVHRDLKPANVMVGSFGEVYVVDWGIATSSGPSSQLAGTPAYMAPEMLGAEGAALSAQTDVYLLGAVLHELVAGQPPHSASTPAAMVESVLRSSPSLPASTPVELAALISATMQPRPEARPQSALAVRIALDDYLAHQGSRELAAQSDRKLAELLAALPRAAPDPRASIPSTAAPETTRVFSLFSECRFGYQQALRGWTGNEQARAGLDRAIHAMVRFELARGAARSAQALLGELVTAAPQLEAEVAAAVELEKEQARQLDRLKELEHNLDPRTGSGLRVGTAVVVAAIWMFSPVASGMVVARWPRYEAIVAVPIAFFTALIILAVGWFARKGRTPLNMHLGRIILFTMLVQALGSLAAFWFVGDLRGYSVTVNCAYWFVVSGVIAVSILREVWPTSLAYLLACVASLRWPEHRYLLVAAANVVFCATAVYIRLSLRARSPAAQPGPPRA